MGEKKKLRLPKWVVALIIITVAVTGVLLLLRNMGERSLLRNRLAIGGNENIKLLKRLNNEWFLPDGYSLEVIEVDSLKMEWVQAKHAKPDKVIVQLHGGAYTRSLKDNGTTYRRAAVKYAQISEAGVLTVDYRVAPKDKYPAALEDAVAAYTWLLDQGYKAEDIIIAGDSAGGGLTLATALYLRDHNMPMPAALITMSAWTNLNYKGRKPAYVGENDAESPYISPAYGEFEGFPPMLLQVGGDEYLLNDTLKVAKKAAAAGVTVRQTTYDSMFHVFQMLFPELDDANEAWNEVEAFIQDIFPQNN